MTTLDDATVCQKVENALLNLSQASESIEIAVYWVPDMFEDHRTVGPALADVAFGKCQNVKMDISIRHEGAVFILAEGVVDHQPAEKTMLFGDLDSNLPLDLERIHVRERNHDVDPPGELLWNAIPDPDVLTTSPEPPAGAFGLF